MLTYPWKCTVLHCNHLGNTWKPLVLMTRHFDYCPSASEHGDNQSVWSSAPVVSMCFPGGYNVKLYISKGRLAWWLLAFLCCDSCDCISFLFFQENAILRVTSLMSSDAAVVSAVSLLNWNATTWTTVVTGLMKGQALVECVSADKFIVKNMHTWNSFYWCPNKTKVFKWASMDSKNTYFYSYDRLCAVLSCHTYYYPASIYVGQIHGFW